MADESSTAAADEYPVATTGYEEDYAAREETLQYAHDEDEDGEADEDA